MNAKKAITGPYGNVREITGKNIGIIGLGNKYAIND